MTDTRPEGLADADEALQVLDREPDIGVVLSDINMPEMDGLTLLSRLTGRGPLPKAVIVSAYATWRTSASP